MALGKLVKIDLREAWKNEASDFTPWLALEENLQLLGDTISIELELEAQEKDVGPFRADILCKDTATGKWVLIENQLEKTDHTHLGQLITYAAGLDAVSIVWISGRFTDEHRAALDWLNENTGNTINFFGLEVELWRIGDSPVAPKFNIISKPNDWSKSVVGGRSSIYGAELKPLQQLKLDFWTGLKEFLIESGSHLKSQKPSPNHYSWFAMGRAGCFVSATIITKAGRIGCAMILAAPNAKPFFHLLQDQRADIENEFGSQLRWDEKPAHKESHIHYVLENADPTDKTRWPEYYEWFKNTLESFHRAFSARIKMLDLNDYVAQEIDERSESK